MERLAKYLLEYETIDEDELTKLFAGEEVSPPLVGETLAHSGEQPENIQIKVTTDIDLKQVNEINFIIFLMIRIRMVLGLFLS